MDLTLFKEGCFVMIIGMGTVFVFLAIMIGMMNVNTIILNFIGKFFPEEVPVVKTQKKVQNTSNDEEIALAIACAMHKVAGGSR